MRGWHRRRPTLPPRVSFAVAAAVLTLSLWASGAPAMLYPVYIDQWGATSLATTALFAVYPIALVLTLISCGSLSDAAGRRTVLVVAMALVAAGTLVFVLAASLPWLFLARLLQGLGVGLALSPAAAALSELDTSGRPARVGAVNTAATSCGAALAIIVGGAVVQYGPSPTTTVFLVLLAAVSLVLVALWFFPDDHRKRARWRPAYPSMPSTQRPQFLLGVSTLTAAFVVGAVFLALGAQIARDLVNTENALAAAAVLATWPLAGLPAALTARRVRVGYAGVLGGLAAAAGAALLTVAGISASLSVFLFASIISGFGYGLMFFAGFTLVNNAAEAPDRAGTLSTMYLSAYFAQGAAAVTIGAVATYASLATAMVVGMPVIAGVCALTAVGHHRARTQPG